MSTPRVPRGWASRCLEPPVTISGAEFHLVSEHGAALAAFDAWIPAYFAWGKSAPGVELLCLFSCGCLRRVIMSGVWPDVVVCDAHKPPRRRPKKKPK